MTEQVKRYHKSFIGLMEQCNDGEWVQSKDFDTLKQQQETASNNATLYADQVLNVEQELEAERALTASKDKQLDTQLHKIIQANKTIFRYKCVILFLIVGIVSMVAGVYHG